MTLIVQVINGSHLYGTQTPTSDVDYKRIHIPDLDKLLLGREKLQSSYTKEGDYDYEDIPLQVLYSRVVSGQTQALETLFAVKSFREHLQSTFDDPTTGCTVAEPNRVVWNQKLPRQALYEVAYLLDEWKRTLINSETVSLMGYVRSMVGTYGARAHNYHDLIEIEETLSTVIESEHIADTVKLGEMPLFSYMMSLTQRTDMLKPVPSPDNVMAFKLSQHTYQLNTDLGTFRKRLRRMTSMYGDRVKGIAADPKPVDLKALTHAIRICQEGIELLTHHRITLPRPELERTYLIAVKTGLEPAEGARQVLDGLWDQLSKLRETTTLREWTVADHDRAQERLLRFLKEWYQVSTAKTLTFV